MECRVYAKLDSSEKVIVLYYYGSNIQEKLNSKFGGQWIWVDDINFDKEFLKFNDSIIYEGFNGKDERYCNEIIKL